jgi:hypothetical protein
MTLPFNLIENFPMTVHLIRYNKYETCYLAGIDE